MRADIQGELVDAYSACLHFIGSDGFIEPFLRAVQLSGAVQCMVFAYQDDRSICLLARNFVAGARGRMLAASYLDGWFRQDPLFAEVMTLAAYECRVKKMSEISGAMSPTYLSHFYTSVGLREKTAVLAALPGLRIALNLYRIADVSTEHVEDADNISASIYRLAGLMAVTHFSQQTQPDYPLLLSSLSERERQVCLGVLEGQKAETIAGAIGIAPNSVVTYRRRAYSKLGITSRAELFSLCKGR